MYCLNKLQSSLAQHLGLDSQHLLDIRQSLEHKGFDAILKGDDFIAIMPKEAELPLNVRGEVEEWVRDIAGIQNKEISADLRLLAQKHPEMFKKPSDVYKLFVQIKNNPTHFLPNNREDVAMIAKIINEKKIGKMGVKKENGEVVHLTKRDIRPKDIKIENPLAVEPPTHYHTSIKEQGDGANAHSLKDTPIIPQKLQELDKTYRTKEEKEKFKAFDFSNTKTQEVKTTLKDYLNAQNVLNHTLKSSDGIEATFSLNSFSKMTSDTAIKKSVDNGFSRNEHLNAVANIKEIYKNARLRETQPHKSGDSNVKIHRLDSEFEDKGVLFTLKESLDKNQKRLYSLELQLIPSLKSADTPLNKSTGKGSSNSLQETKGGDKSPESSIVKTDTPIIPQKLQWSKHTNLDETSLTLSNLKGDELVEVKAINELKAQIIQSLDTLATEHLPQTISKAEFLQTGLEQVINKSNFLKHIQSKNDSFNRIKYLNLIEPTLKRPNIEFTEGEKKGYIKIFIGDDKKLFYVLITEQEDKLLITGIPTTKKREVIRQINKADSIRGVTHSGDELPATALANANKSTTANPIIPQKLQWSKHTNLDETSLTLSNGKKLLIHKDSFDNIYIQSDMQPSQARSYDELKINQSLSDFEKYNIEQKFINHMRNKKQLLKPQSADEIIQSEITKAQEESKSKQRYLETKHKQEAILQEKEANLNKRIDEVALSQGESIPYKPIRDTKIILSDDTPALSAQYVIIDYHDIVPIFERSQTQGRVIKQEKVIQNIINDFNPDLLIPREGGADGAPIITKDGQVIAGNHRALSLQTILDAPQHQDKALRYRESVKDFLHIDLEPTQMIVRRVNDNVSQEDILSLAFSSNKGRESTMGEKALSNLAYFKQNMSYLPQHIESENVDELKSFVASILDKQGGGLDTFNTNLALLAHIAPNAKNADIISALDSIKGSPDERVKLINMFVDNAGSFYNLSQNKLLPSLDLRAYLSESILNVSRRHSTRALDLENLNISINDFLNAGEEGQKAILALDSDKVKHLISDALSVALAKFVRQENPSTALYESLKNAPKALEEQTQPTLLSEGKPLSAVDIYDFVQYLISEGQSSKQTSELIALLPKLREAESKTFQDSKATQELENIVFNDKKGNEKILTKEVQEQWLKTFNLKSLDEDFIPHIAQEAKEALEKQGFSGEIHLKSGSLVKLIKENRLKYLDRIKPTLETPDKIIRQDESTIIFAKDFNDKKYFTSVSRNQSGEWIVRSNAPKSENGLNNKVAQGGEVIFDRQAPAQINANEAYDDIAKSNTKLDNAIIPQRKGTYDNSITHDSKLDHSSNSDTDTLYPLSGSHSQERGGVESYSGAREAFTYHTKEPQAIATLRKELKDALSPYLNREIINKQTGDSAQISNKGIKKMSSSEAVKKSMANGYTRDEHFKVASAVKEIFENADLQKITKDLKHNDPNVKIYRFIQEVSVNEKPANALITLKETIERGKKIYSIELESLDPLPKNQIAGKLDKQGQFSLTKDNSTANVAPIEKTDNDIIPQSKAKQKLEKQIAQYEDRIRILDKKLSSAGEVARKNYDANFAERELYQELLFKAKKAYYDIPEPSEDLPYRKFFKAQSKTKLEDIFSGAEEAMKPENLKEFLHKRGNEYYLKAFRKYLFDPHSLSFKHEIEIAQKDIILLKRYAAANAPYSRDLELRNGAEFRAEIERAFDIHPIKDFGTNYAEFYHDGKGAINKLLHEKQGQVSGAFYREDLKELSGNGEIDLVWGDSKFGLKHILDKHEKEFSDIAQELSEIVERGVLEKAKDNKYTLKTQKHTLVLGQRENNDFIITAYKDRRNEKLGNHQTVVGDDFTDEPLAKQPLSSNQNDIIPRFENHLSENKKFKIEFLETLDLNPLEYNFLRDKILGAKALKQDVSQQIRNKLQESLNLHPNPAFGTNYAEFYHDGKGAIDKLIDEYYQWQMLFKDPNEFSGQVAGAFYREDLKELSGNGEIDLVWGDSKFGLKHILDKHEKEFSDIARELSEIVERGELKKDDKGRLRIETQNYIIGVKDNWKGEKTNNWIVTAYEKKGGGGSLYTSPHNDLGEILPKTPNDIIPQSKIQSNPHIGSGLVGGSLAGVEEDESGNLTFDPSKFALGFLGAAVGSKAVAKGFQTLKANPQLKEAVVKELGNALALGFESAKAKYPILQTLEPRYIVKNEKGRIAQAKAMLSKLEQREQKGIYNVAYNGKNATKVYKDLEKIDEAIVLERGTKRKGGVHIKLSHSTDTQQQGYVTHQEVANLGKNIRKYIAKYHDPFIDSNGARLYEWQDKEGVKFRVVVNDLQESSGGNSLLPSATEEIITFYSDRNLKNPMSFKNPSLK